MIYIFGINQVSIKRSTAITALKIANWSCTGFQVLHIVITFSDFYAKHLSVSPLVCGAT